MFLIFLSYSFRYVVSLPCGQVPLIAFDNYCKSQEDAKEVKASASVLVQGF